jgi:hypothetical protein
VARIRSESHILEIKLKNSIEVGNKAEVASNLLESPN